MHAYNNKGHSEIQLQISRFLNDIMSMETFLQTVIISIQNMPDNSTKIRKYKESELSATVLKEFPKHNTFSGIEGDNREKSILTSTGSAMRKAIILLHYVTFAYEASFTLSGSQFDSPLFHDFSFEAFISDLNTVLYRCNLSPLYPANQFDWLILRSVNALMEIDTDYVDEPTKFFNDVLTFSFGEQPEE